MINIILEGHNYRNELFDIVRLFCQDDDITFIDKPREDSRGVFILSRVIESEASYDVYIELCNSNIKLSGCSIINKSNDIEGEAGTKKLIKRELKRQTYILLSKLFRKHMPWGMLTGIRPAKIVNEMLENGLGREEILSKLRDYYFVSEEKALLAYSVAQTEKTFLDRSTSDMTGIYIGIPFCPTRCLYCSFTSNPIKQYEKLVKKYLEVLFREIEYAGQLVKEKNLKIQSIYIGGGTPTSITAEELQDLLKHIEATLDISCLEEYTLEAGRPDSITKDKLCAIKSSKVNRISINPQSMNEETLKLIGRNHSSEDIKDCFDLARKLGFKNINMDIIAGLPGENHLMFENTLKEIEKLGPDSLTVHTMSIKRASRLKEEKEKYSLERSEEVEAMIELAKRCAKGMGMHPYYLYRQKNILGNLENVGYSKPGYESVYNIQIMEERQTIIALGAGGITKVVYPGENRIERAFNVKSVEDYICRLDEMLERKKALLYDM